LIFDKIITDYVMSCFYWSQYIAKNRFFGLHFCCRQ